MATKPDPWHRCAPPARHHLAHFFRAPAPYPIPEAGVARLRWRFHYVFLAGVYLFLLGAGPLCVLVGAVVIAVLGLCGVVRMAQP